MEKVDSVSVSGHTIESGDTVVVTGDVEFGGVSFKPGESLDVERVFEDSVDGSSLRLVTKNGPVLVSEFNINMFFESGDLTVGR